MRAAYYKSAGWIYKILCIIINKFSRNCSFNNFFNNIWTKLWKLNICTVLAWYNDSSNLYRLIIIVFNSNLCFTVSIKIRKCTVFSDFCKLNCKFMSKADRKRHKLLCFVASVTEHHTLVTCTVQVILIFIIVFKFKWLINTHCNIGRLMVKCKQNSASITVKTFLIVIISNIANCFSYDRRNINLCFSCNFTHYKNLAGCTCCFTGNTALWVLLKHSIKNRIWNLVTNFIRMTFCYGFTGKQMFWHNNIL